MSSKKNLGYLSLRKRRVLGEIIQATELTTAHAWVSIHASSKELLMTYESKGLVASINGSGALSPDHHQCTLAREISQYVAAQGGIIINGGRSSGIMEASSESAPENSIGIVFSDISKEANKFGKKNIVGEPHPRIELLATAAPIVVVFRGGLGTLMVLMRSIVHLNNGRFNEDQPSQMVFVSDYWIGLLTTMMNLGALPKAFIQQLHFFSKSEQIIKLIPTT